MSLFRTFWIVIAWACMTMEYILDKGPTTPYINQCKDGKEHDDTRGFLVPLLDFVVLFNPLCSFREEEQQKQSQSLDVQLRTHEPFLTLIPIAMMVGN